MNNRLSKTQNRSVICAFIMSGCATKDTLSDFIISLGKSQLYMDFTSYKYFIDDSVIFATDPMNTWITGVSYDELNEAVKKKIVDPSNKLGYPVSVN
ncbi:hypothetical protein HPMBJEAJ_00313 [Aeromonas phage avDM6]|nr:hypothetical protein HPMBJEAJ_00313 [Aeromonas phage avDM6]